MARVLYQHYLKDEQRTKPGLNPVLEAANDYALILRWMPDRKESKKKKKKRIKAAELALEEFDPGMRTYSSLKSHLGEESRAV